jgi:flagellar hook-associated protein 3 FlgL
MSYLNLLQDINRAQESVQAAQNQVSPGKKVLNPSDDPTAAADIEQLTSEGAEADQYARNVTLLSPNSGNSTTNVSTACTKVGGY